MRGVLIRIIVALGAIAGVLVALLAGLSLGTGVNVGDLIPGVAQPAATPIDTTGAPDAPGAITDSSTVQFEWRGDQIFYEGNPISEEQFSELLSQARANNAPVEVVKTSDVTVEDADRWRRLMEDAQVQHEIILTE